MSTEHEQHVTLLDLREQIIAGRFKLLRRLRRGSYAEVWIAHNLSPKEGEPMTVAVKVLNPGLQGVFDSRMETLLTDNIKLEDYSLRRVRHPHIVRLFESGEDSDRRTGRQFYYLVLELLEGGDLYNLCHVNRLRLDDALAYVAQACSALTCAHQHGIIHRDIKPNNFLLTKDRRTLKALDFGTARVLDKQNGSITRVGTEVYAAPESYTPGDSAVVTAAADVYSLAKVLLFMLTGDSPAHLAQKQITFLAPDLMTEAWGPSLLSVLSKATCDEPSSRYQSVEEFHHALRQVLELTEVSVGNSADFPRERLEYYEPPKFTRFEVPVINAQGFAAVLPTNGLDLAGVSDAFHRLIHDAWSNIPNRLVVQVLAVVTIVALVLMAASQILPLLHRSTVSVVKTQKTADPLIGREAQTDTDVNIRSSAGSEHDKIGLVEKDSRVKILSYNSDRTWYEVEVLAHSRPKIDPTSSDHGWVRSKFLTLAGSKPDLN